MIINEIKYTIVGYLTAASIQAIVRRTMTEVADLFNLIQEATAVNAFEEQKLDSFRTMRVVWLSIQYADSTDETTIVGTVLTNQLSTMNIGEVFVGYQKFE